MARVENELRLVPSVWDRLSDEQPDKSSDSSQNRFQNVAELKATVARDLETLLNTRQEALGELPAGFPETNRSLLTYGLPDFTAYSLRNEQDRNRIQRALEQTITNFETRLKRVHVVLDPLNELQQALHFRVEALLKIQPAPAQVTFDAVLELNTHQYTVQGHAR